MAESLQKAGRPQVSPEVEKDFADFQNAQRQLQNVLVQKQQMQIGLEEVKGALESVEGTTGDVYKVAGGLLLSTTKESAKKELADKKEMFELRMGQFSKQEASLTARLTELKGKIEVAAKKMQQASA